MEDLSKFQEFLTEAYARWSNRGVRRSRLVPSENQFALWLGVKPATFNSWINGTRRPDIQSAMLLADKLGSGVFESLDMPRVAKITDDRLWLVVKNWENYSDAQRDELLNAIRGEATGAD